MKEIKAWHDIKTMIDGEKTDIVMIVFVDHIQHL